MTTPKPNPTPSKSAAGRYGEPYKVVARLTLRDQFAMAALQGMLSAPEYISSAEWAVDEAYDFADLMLSRRKRRPDHE